MATTAVCAEPEKLAAVPADAPTTAPSSLDPAAPPEIMAAPPNGAPPSALAAAIRQALSALPTAQTDRDQELQAAVAAFYAARADAPLWTASNDATAKAEALTAEIARAADYGLDPADFALPRPQEASDDTARAAAETAYTLAALKYADHARGARIMKPAVDLSSYLDRAPQLLDPKAVLAELAASSDVATTLRGFHPKHPQFELLRQRYVALRAADKSPRKSVKSLSPEAKRLLANMEQWRWMPSDLGLLYVWNNIPEYIQRVVDKGEIVNTERIVAGEIGKQTPIFSRPMRKIVFRPKWKVPESIKVREIWPSLLRGGGLLAQYGLEIETKDGKPVDPRTVNWAKEDIRNYEVIQPPGPKSVLGVVKFTFPNPHTVYMHDTQDKHLFAATQRTYSHGCMRVKNPLRLAELLLASDQGLDAAAIAGFVKSGPLDNEVALQRKIPVHVTYFTALASDDGKVTMFRDVYGHEKRIIQALEGRWTEIAKGRDHLAPVEPDMAAAVRPRPVAQRPQGQKPFDFLSAVFSGGF
jgi:murein L,D-transpeptidase YcbB/YkuD